jgi:hypothetical protein
MRAEKESDLIVTLPAQEVRDYFRKNLKEEPQKANWGRFWCGSWEDDWTFSAHFHNGAIHWNENQIRPRIVAKIEALAPQKTRITYEVFLSKGFRDFALLWGGVVLGLTIFGVWAWFELTWVSPSIRGLWLALPIFMIPGAASFTYQKYWKLKNKPVRWLRKTLNKLSQKPVATS